MENDRRGLSTVRYGKVKPKPELTDQSKNEGPDPNKGRLIDTIMLIESFGHRPSLRLLWHLRLPLRLPLQPTASPSIQTRRNSGLPSCYNRVAHDFRSRTLRKLSYSRMLDMGGSPSSSSDQSLIRTVNASKNSRLQAVAFDFQTLINIDDRKTNATGQPTSNDQRLPERRDSIPAAAAAAAAAETTTADVDRVQQVADLLNVELGASKNDTGSEQNSLHSAAAAAATTTAATPTKEREPKLKDHDPSAHDIRAKYASKLKGGLAGIELAKSQVEETLVAGDAAGHLAARKIAILDGVAPNSGGGTAANRWLPSQEATSLLTLLTHRSIRIVLLPSLDSTSTSTSTDGDDDEPKMEDFKSQLKNVIIDKLVPEFDNGNDSESGIEDTIRKGVLKELDVDPNNVLLVSQREPYLRVGRDMGMNICRIRPKNGRRGSITAHYTVENVGEIQDVVNEINGISFNTVLNR